MQQLLKIHGRKVQWELTNVSYSDPLLEVFIDPFVTLKVNQKQYLLAILSFDHIQRESQLNSSTKQQFIATIFMV